MNPNSEDSNTQKAVENLTAGGNITIGNITQNINNPSNPPKPKAIPQNLPRSGVIKFVGREKVLKNLHQQLQQNERVAISAITGMGGIGKTELALQYGDRHWKQGIYSGGICWFRVRDEDVGIQIVNFAREIGLQPPDDFDLLNKVKYCWRNWQAGDVLVVFDDVENYEQIKEYLPPNEPRFKVLVTTRQQWLGQSFRRLILEVLEEKAALELLVSFVGEERIYQEEEEAKRLCVDLGYLPLGLELVARYLQRKPNLSLVEMCQRLALEHRSLREASGDMTAQLGVAAAFELSWQELDKHAQGLACWLSIFALAPIPWKLVEQCLPEEDKEDLEDIRDDFLVNLSLLEDKGENTYQLHQLIREFLIGKREELADVEVMKRGFCQTILAVAKDIPETPNRKQIIDLASAISHMVELITNLTIYLSDEDLNLPFIALGELYKGQGLYERAKICYQNFLAITQQRFNTDNPQVAVSMSKLASIYYIQANYTDAEILNQQALNIRRKLLEDEHLDIADSLNNLALTYHKQGRYQDAEHLYEQSLQIRSKLLGEEHPDVTDSFNNIALLYDEQGRYQEAEILFIKALEIRKIVLGKEHPRVVTSLNNLASCYHYQERYQEAEEFYLQALDLSKNVLGEEHHDVAITLNNLALIYINKKKFKLAEPKLIEALNIQKHIFGEEHPDIATGINNLAFFYEDIGNIEEAESLYKQALEMETRLLGEKHLDVAITYNNLAKLYYSQNQYTKAKPLYIKAIEIIEPQLESDHYLVVKIKSNLEELQSAMKISSDNA